ncbi:MAG: hypothetical protein WA971_10830 [Microbacterium sp.]
MHTSTIVTFAAGSVVEEATVLRVQADGVGAVVVLDRTPFHPVDHTWPDQPGDSGVLRLGDVDLPVSEAVMAAVSDAGEFALGTGIPAKRGTEGWAWLVGHPVTAVPEGFVEGARIEAVVDVGRRAALSRGHTACHLSSLALDLATADLWRKDPGVDPLGNPDFEGRAGQSSRIHEDGAIDEYRLGKSLRRAGFDAEGFASSLPEREARINEALAGWVASCAPGRIVTDGSTIADRRRWECDLPEGTVSFPCGGTHAASLREFASITVTLDLSDPQVLVMATTAVPA